LAGDYDFKMNIDRTSFEELNNLLFQRLELLVLKVLNESNISKDQVNEIEIVGGTSRIPKLQQILKQIFSREDLGNRINADEGAVIGTGYRGISLRSSVAAEKFQLKDTRPTISIHNPGGSEFLIPKKTNTERFTVLLSFSKKEGRTFDIRYHQEDFTSLSPGVSPIIESYTLTTEVLDQNGIQNAIDLALHLKWTANKLLLDSIEIAHGETSTNSITIID